MDAALAVPLEVAAVAAKAAMGDPISRMAVEAMMVPARRDPSIRMAAMLPWLPPRLPARRDPSIRMVALLPWLPPRLPAHPLSRLMW